MIIKINLLIFSIALLLVSCQKSTKNYAEKEEIEWAKKRFISQFQMTGIQDKSPFVVGCKIQFDSLIHHLKIGDKFRIFNDRHFYTICTITNFTKEKLIIHFENFYSGLDGSFQTIGNFDLPFEYRELPKDEIWIGKELLSKNLVEKHIKEGKFMLLKNVAKQKFWSKTDPCYSKALDYFGLKINLVDECIALKSTIDLIDDYNLRMIKHFDGSINLNKDSVNKKFGAIYQEIMACKKLKK